MLRVLVVGYGYWGPNLVRNLVLCPRTRPVGICDRDARRLAKARNIFPFIDTYSELDQALATTGLPQLEQTAGLNLADPLARDAVHLGDLIQRPRMPVVQAKAQLDHFPLASMVTKGNTRLFF